MDDVSHQQKRRVDLAFAGGVAWTATAKWITQVFSWASVFLAARILSKSDFGFSNMSAFFFVMANTLAEFGVGTAVLQMRELEPRVLAQLHSFSCMLSTAAYLVSIPAAPLIASFFFSGRPDEMARMSTLIIVNNAAFFITGFQAVPTGLLQRDMDYRRLSIAEACQSLVQAISTVIFALLGFGYWSLTLGPGLGRVTACALVCWWKPVPFARIRWKDVRPPLRMGGQTAVGRLAWSAYIQADGVTIGRILGKSALGMYGMAMTLAAAPAEKVSSLIMRATGPLFAQVQSNVEQARRYFLTLAELLTMVELPLMLGLGVVAPEVQAILGGKWAGLAGPLRWLVMFMTMRTLNTLMEQVLISRRQTRFTMSMSIVNFCIMPAAFVVAALWKGPSGVAASWLVLTPITLLPVIWKLVRTIDLPVRELASALLPAVAGAGTMVGSLVLLRHLPAMQTWPVLARLVIQVAAGALVYAGFQMTFFRSRVMRYVRFVWDLRKENATLLKGRL